MVAVDGGGGVSRAAAMSNDRRIRLYTRRLTAGKTVDGIYRLTPKQRRRATHKWNHDLRKHGGVFPANRGTA